MAVLPEPREHPASDCPAMTLSELRTLLLLLSLSSPLPISAGISGRDGEPSGSTVGLLRGLCVGLGLLMRDDVGMGLGLGLERESAVRVRVRVSNLGVDVQVVLLVFAGAVHCFSLLFR